MTRRDRMREGRRALRGGVMLMALLLVGGCAHWDGLDAGYAWQSATGHIALLRAARPVDDWLADPATPPALQQRLRLSQRLRDFAVQSLHLPDNASYRRYADLHREAAVWNVVATPELSLQLKTWCFPVVGCVGYRGYFDRAQADALAAHLRSQGWEAEVTAVPAYSTLNKVGGSFFADPLLNTFINWTEGELAGLVFHELAHQVVYAAGDTRFNESFATAVERLGVQSWWASAKATPGAREADARREARREDFRELVRRHRDALQALYSSSADDATKRREKAAILLRLREGYAQLKATRWGGYAGYDRWMERAGNPLLALQAAYDDDVDAFMHLHAEHGGRWDDFYAAARALAALPQAQREAAVRQLKPPVR